MSPAPGRLRISVLTVLRAPMLSALPSPKLTLPGLMLFALLLLAGILCLPLPEAAARQPSEPMPPPEKRTILALYDGNQGDGSPRQAQVHSFATMPLNHLGLRVRYHDMRQPLPEPEELSDVRGILTWFGGPVPEPDTYLAWALERMADGMPFAVLGDPGSGNAAAWAQARFVHQLGLEAAGGFRLLTYDVELVNNDAGMIGFERAPMRPYPAYVEYVATGTDLQIHLSARAPAQDRPRVLVATGPGGGFAASGYEIYFDSQIFRGRWIIDPFAFFERTFALRDLPRPDTTTLAGRRIYFSHVDGDGWRNASWVPGYRGQASGATRALLDKAWAAYPALPVTVAPIAAELDTDFLGQQADRDIAQRLFALPHVEAATHTYSHPFLWRFFRNYDPASERRVEATAGRLPADSGAAWDRMMARFGLGPEARYLAGDAVDDGDYVVMRAFAEVPYDLDREIAGSARLIQTLLPPGKQVRLLQWSGDTAPFAAAVNATRIAGLLNMNGGDTRFDPEFPSTLFVAPVAYSGENILQPYAQSSNENTYTNLWRERFYGLRFLAATLANTESPRRLKPFNLYYHNYSGEQPESLAAVTGLLDLAMASELIPIEASHFAAIADGFHYLELIVMPEDGDGHGDGHGDSPGDSVHAGPAWQVTDRGALNTLRFDRAAFRAVDFDRSRGILGQRHHQGALYVALDPDADDPVVALAGIDRTDRSPDGGRPYLVASRWPVRSLAVAEDGSFSAIVAGYGEGEFLWQATPGRDYVLRAERLDRGQATAGAAKAPVWSDTARADAQGRLAFTIAADGLTDLKLRATALASDNQ